MNKEKGRLIYVFDNHEDAEYFFRDLEEFEYENEFKSEDEKEEAVDQYWWPDNMHEVEYFEKDILSRGPEGRINEPYFEVIENKDFERIGHKHICVWFPTFDTDCEPYGVLVDWDFEKDEESKNIMKKICDDVLEDLEEGN